MPNRSHIGLDNPAFSGRVRQPNNFAQFLPGSEESHGPELAWPEASKVLLSGVLTRPFYQPKLPRRSAPPERSRYRAAEPAHKDPIPKIVTELITPLAETTQPVVPQAVAASAYQVPIQPIQSERILATAIPARSASNGLYDDSQNWVEEFRATSLAAHQPQPSQVLTRPNNHQTEEYVPEPAARAAFPKPNFKLPNLSIGRLPKVDLVKLQTNLAGYTRLQFTLVGMAAVMFIFGLSVSINTLHTNKLATNKVTAISQGAANDPAVAGDAANKAGNSSLPSTVRPSHSAVASYAVAPNMPRYLNIPKLGVHARALSLGILNNGALATPSNVFDVGWYNESALPGQQGAVLIDGHVSSWTTKGVFYGIKSLLAGDEIQIVRGDAKVFTYKVVKVHVFDHEKVNMQSAVTPVIPGKGGLNLITCTGDVIPGTNEFDERVIVYASQV
ncbi:MAG TPA: sortase [Candidatus Saccharimonadales bacterium]|nr:sortase [Candidatus Saccharimonadales bacterium]